MKVARHPIREERHDQENAEDFQEQRETFPEKRGMNRRRWNVPGGTHTGNPFKRAVNKRRLCGCGTR